MSTILTLGMRPYNYVGLIEIDRNNNSSSSSIRAIAFPILLLVTFLTRQSVAVVYAPGSSSSLTADPDCSTGVAGQGRFRGVCCHIQCGSGCGGPGCKDLPGGRESCCTGAIVAADKSCQNHPPPCRLDNINPCETTGSASQEDPLDVLVIGAGWSGLAAGSRLLASTTTNFCILEGREVKGGRSRTLMSYFEPGLPTELGSGWIYPGSNVFRVFQSAGLITDVPTFFNLDDLGIYLKPDATTAGLYGGGGLLVNDGAIRTAYENFIKYAKSSARHDVSIQAIKDAYLLQNQNQLSTLEIQAVETLVTSILHSEWGAYLSDADSSAMLDYLDYSYSINYAGIPGSGFGPALEYFAAPFANHISYNKQVVEIDYGAPASNNQLVKVTSIDQTTGATTIRYARAVICTVSLGVLKHGDLRFVPSLPSTKTQAIQNMAFGNKNKCFLYWDATTTDLSWWPHGITDLQLIMQDANADSNKEWTMFLNDQNHRGNENIYVLSAWIGGVHADAWEKRTDDETVQHVMGNLRKMFPTAVIPEPTKFLVTRWKSDPFTRGTYSYYKAGVDYGRGALDLAEPVGNNLYFAGEATWPSGMGAPDAFSSGVAAVMSVAQSGVLLQQLPLGPTTSSQQLPDAIVVQTASPTTALPTLKPTSLPTTALPTLKPTSLPTTAMPTPAPTTTVPTLKPTPPTPAEQAETTSPTTAVPTLQSTTSPTTALPTLKPTPEPTPEPTFSPATEPEDTADWNFLDWFFGTPSPTPSLRSPTNSPTISSSPSLVAANLRPSVPLPTWSNPANPIPTWSSPKPAETATITTTTTTGEPAAAASTNSPTNSPTIMTVVSSAMSASASLCGRTGFPCEKGGDCCEDFDCQLSSSRVVGRTDGVCVGSY